MPGEVLRTFIAIELSATLRLALSRVQNNFKQLTPPGSVKWVAPESIHLTLKFLGDTPTGRLAEIQKALVAACADFAPFDVSVEGRGCFPNFRRPRVIWVAVRERGQMLTRLQTAIERQVAPLGWPTETRGFSPHLTLGRVSKNANSTMEAAVGQAVETSVVEQIGVQRVSTVKLVRSELMRAGPVYTTLAEVPLERPSGT